MKITVINNSNVIVVAGSGNVTLSPCNCYVDVQESNKRIYVKNLDLVTYYNVTNIPEDFNESKYLFDGESFTVNPNYNENDYSSGDEEEV